MAKMDINKLLRGMAALAQFPDVMAAVNTAISKSESAAMATEAGRTMKETSFALWAEVARLGYEHDLPAEVLADGVEAQARGSERPPSDATIRQYKSAVSGLIRAAQVEDFAALCAEAGLKDDKIPATAFELERGQAQKVFRALKLRGAVTALDRVTAALTLLSKTARNFAIADTKGLEKGQKAERKEKHALEALPTLERIIVELGGNLMVLPVVGEAIEDADDETDAQAPASEVAAGLLGIEAAEPRDAAA